LRDRKTNFKSFTYCGSSTDAADLARFGPVNVQIIGATESLKIEKKNKKLNKEHASVLVSVTILYPPYQTFLVMLMTH